MLLSCKISSGGPSGRGGRRDTHTHICAQAPKERQNASLCPVSWKTNLVGGCGGFCVREGGRGRLGGEGELWDEAGRRSSVAFIICWRSCDGGRVVAGLDAVSLMAL